MQVLGKGEKKKSKAARGNNFNSSKIDTTRHKLRSWERTERGGGGRGLEKQSPGFLEGPQKSKIKHLSNLKMTRLKLGQEVRLKTDCRNEIREVEK